MYIRHSILSFTWKITLVTIITKKFKCYTLVTSPPVFNNKIEHNRNLVSTIVAKVVQVSSYSNAIMFDRNILSCNINYNRPQLQ